jgi:hypothetical protein
MSMTAQHLSKAREEAITINLLTIMSLARGVDNGVQKFT